MDLEIPARTGHGDARINHGRHLIEQIQRLKGRHVLPVMVMTAHHGHGLNLVTEFLGKGVMDFIAKPFGDGATDRDLAGVIKGVLERHGRSFPPGTAVGEAPEPFRGGTLAFYDAHVELNGVTIVEKSTSPLAWAILQILRRRGVGDVPRQLSARKLARLVHPKNPPTDNAIASAIHDLRERIAAVMLAEANVVVASEDVIVNQRGYRLAGWLTVEEHDAAGGAGADETAGGAVAEVDRQQWILEQIAEGVWLTREMVERRFHIGEKQAQRELQALGGKVRFVRKPWPGYWALG